MKASSGIVRGGLLGCAIAFGMGSASAEVIFMDDFESASFSKKIGSAAWSYPNNVTVSTAKPKSGSYSAQFKFAGNTSTAWDADAHSELRFDLGALKQEIWIQYDLFIPSNYKHRNAEGTDNNKFIRLWPSDYNDAEKIGFSMWPVNGYSNLQADWSYQNEGIGPKGPAYTSFITASDLGKWMTIKIYVKAATSTQKGTLNLWKNGQLIISNTNTMNNYWSSNAHAFRYGYLLGWSNSGFSETTYLYIDNITFATKESDLGDAVAPPEAPRILDLQ